MTEASGFFERGGMTEAPTVRLGVGFGPDRVVVTSALVDTGSDVCVFPPDIFPWSLPDRVETYVTVETLGERSFVARLRFPTITVGSLRERHVPSVLLTGATPILGRSFLSRCALEVSAPRDLVRLRSVGPRREGR